MRPGTVRHEPGHVHRRCGIGGERRLPEERGSGRDAGLSHLPGQEAGAPGLHRRGPGRKRAGVPALPEDGL